MECSPNLKWTQTPFEICSSDPSIHLLTLLSCTQASPCYLRPKAGHTLYKLPGYCSLILKYCTSSSEIDVMLHVKLVFSTWFLQGNTWNYWDREIIATAVRHYGQKHHLHKPAHTHTGFTDLIRCFSADWSWFLLFCVFLNSCWWTSE